MINCNNGQCAKPCGKSGCTKIPLMRRFVLQNFPFIEKDFDALTDYELLCKVVEYLNQVITSQNCVVDKMNELITAFEQLKDFVDHYFDNLDVQEEINNKLDQMVEDGTLENIVRKHIKELIVDTLNLSKKLEIFDGYSDVYNGESFYPFLQGFCEINDNIVACFYNSSKLNNYTRISEIDPTSGNIIRSNYLELNHGNSITYDETNGLMYVASNSKFEDGSLVPENSIKVVQYSNFQLVKTINISNLPNDRRIRNVYFDNDSQTLYAGDNYHVFEIDVENELITNTISLDVVSDNVNNTNQTIKLWRNMFVGVFFGFIAFWDKSGSLIRTIQLNQIQGGTKIGEVEDFYIEENGDVILGFSKKIANDRKQRLSTFYISNFWKDNQAQFIPYIAKNDDRPTVVYVNNTSTETIEDGTSRYPFKDLQTAVGIAKNTQDHLSIHILGDSYEYISIDGINALDISFDENVVIKGMTINKSNVSFTTSGTKYATIKGLGCVRSKVQFTGNSTNKCVIDPFSNSNLMSGVLSYRNGIGLHCTDSDIVFSNCDIKGDGNHDSAFIDYTNATFISCNFNGYDLHYAINIEGGSNVNLARNTFGSYSVSASQHRFRIAEGAILHSQPNLSAKYNYVTSYNGRVYGVGVEDTTVTDTYIGDVCSVDSDYDMMKIRVKIGGLNSTYKYVEIPTTEASQILIDTEWSNATAFNLNTMVVRIVEGVLTIQEHYRTPMNTTTYNRESITETPASTTNYSCITDVIYYNL